MKQAFPTIKPTLYDPTQSDYSTNPFTAAGTFQTFQGIDPQGNPTAIHSLEPNAFTANTLGQKALDAIKSDTGININVQWKPPYAAGVQGYYAPQDPSNTQDSRTINFTSDQPDINVLLHGRGSIHVLPTRYALPLCPFVVTLVSLCGKIKTKSINH